MATLDILSAVSMLRRGHQCGMSMFEDTHILARMFAAAMDGWMDGSILPL
jgi:hypothetical protein